LRWVLAARLRSATRCSSRKRRTHGPSKVCSVMATLPSRVALEAPIGLCQQLRRHAQVDLRGGQLHMPQVDRQLGQQLLHIDPLPIPGRQPVDGEGVAQVVQPRLVARAGPPDAGLLTHTQEAFVDGVLIQPRARALVKNGASAAGPGGAGRRPMYPAKASPNFGLKGINRVLENLAWPTLSRSFSMSTSARSRAIASWRRRPAP